jgi:hypothetical protein
MSVVLRGRLTKKRTDGGDMVRHLVCMESQRGPVVVVKSEQSEWRKEQDMPDSHCGSIMGIDKQRNVVKDKIQRKMR